MSDNEKTDRQGDSMEYTVRIKGDEVKIKISGYTHPVNAFEAVAELNHPEVMQAAVQGYLAALKHHREEGPTERASYTTTLT